MIYHKIYLPAICQCQEIPFTLRIGTDIYTFLLWFVVGYHHYPWMIIIIIWTCLCTLINFTAMAQFVFVSKAIIIRFNEIFLDLEFLINDNVPFDEPVFIKFYQRHYLVCEMVTEANIYWKKYLFIFYVVFVPLVTIQLYELLIAFVSSYMVKIVFFISTTGCLGQILRVSFSASSVVFEAHRPYHLIHGLTIRNWSIEVKTQVKCRFNSICFNNSI